VDNPVDQETGHSATRGGTEQSERSHSLAPHEEWVTANALRERAVLLDSARRIVTRKEGERDGVVWTEEALRALHGRVDLVTHIHPGGSSLGENDVDLALLLNAREVNAITATHRFRLYRLENAWPAKGALASVVATERAQLIAEMIAARNEGRIDDEGIEKLFYHALWQRVVKHFPGRLSYVAEER
jgi:hypothetical protein